MQTDGGRITATLKPLLLPHVCTTEESLVYYSNSLSLNLVIHTKEQSMNEKSHCAKINKSLSMGANISAD